MTSATLTRSLFLVLSMLALVRCELKSSSVEPVDVRGPLDLESGNKVEFRRVAHADASREWDPNSAHGVQIDKLGAAQHSWRLQRTGGEPFVTPLDRTFDSAVTSFLDTGLSTGVDYHYTVSEIGANGVLSSVEFRVSLFPSRVVGRTEYLREEDSNLKFTRLLFTKDAALVAKSLDWEADEVIFEPGSQLVASADDVFYGPTQGRLQIRAERAKGKLHLELQHAYGEKKAYWKHQPFILDVRNPDPELKVTRRAAIGTLQGPQNELSLPPTYLKLGDRYLLPCRQNFVDGSLFHGNFGLTLDTPLEGQFAIVAPTRGFIYFYEFYGPTKLKMSLTLAEADCKIDEGKPRLTFFRGGPPEQERLVLTKKEAAEYSAKTAVALQAAISRLHTSLVPFHVEADFGEPVDLSEASHRTDSFSEWQVRIANALASNPKRVATFLKQRGADKIYFFNNNLNSSTEFFFRDGILWIPRESSYDVDQTVRAIADNSLHAPKLQDVNPTPIGPIKY